MAQRYTSTIAPLAAAAEWSDILYAGREDNLVGIVKSDQAGTLHLEQSADGVNWDIDDPVTVVANTGQRFSVPIVGNRIRVRYTNGATPQTFLRVSARFGSAGPR